MKKQHSNEPVLCGHSKLEAEEVGEVVVVVVVVLCVNVNGKGEEECLE